jgi:hypothetical protein
VPDWISHLAPVIPSKHFYLHQVPSKDEMRRVVVTGLGAITPLGLGELTLKVVYLPSSAANVKVQEPNDHGNASSMDIAEYAHYAIKAMYSAHFQVKLLARCH